MSAIASALDDYQRFTESTAQFPEALALPYLGLGLGDEAGEILEKVIAIHCGRTGAAAREGVVKECGDTLWYLGQLLRKFGLGLGEVFIASTMAGGVYDATLLTVAAEVSVKASAIQGRIKKHLRDGIDVQTAVFELASQLLRALDTLLRVCGSNLLLAAADNRTKLESRLSRGVIKGEGDAR